MAQATSPHPEGKPMTLQTGEWEGEYIDVYGHRGTLHMTLEDSAGSLSGKYELTIQSEDKPKVMTGEITGVVEGDSVGLTLAMGKNAEKAEYRAWIRHAGGFALQSLVGFVDPIPGSGFGGGVWVAWRFGKRG